MKMNENDRKLITPKEAAEFLGVSLRTLWWWRIKGIIPAYRLSHGVVRFDIDELLKIARERAEEDIRRYENR